MGFLVGGDDVAIADEEPHEAFGVRPVDYFALAQEGRSVTPKAFLEDGSLSFDPIASAVRPGVPPSGSRATPRASYRVAAIRL